MYQIIHRNTLLPGAFPNSHFINCLIGHFISHSIENTPEFDNVRDKVADKVSKSGFRGRVLRIAESTMILALLLASGASTLAQVNLPPTGIDLGWSKTAVIVLNAKRSEASLDGVWRFIPAVAGEATPPRLGWGYIKVPGNWQNRPGRRSALVAVGGGPQWGLYDGARVASAWYERQVRIPAQWRGRVISLRFDRVCTDAIVYVNGVKCGQVPWPWGSVDITRAVTPGKTATIQVLVAAIPDAQKVGHFWQNAFLNVTYTAARLRARGLTGGVYMESRSSEAHVRGVFVRTSTRKKDIALDVDLAGVKESGQVSFVADMLDEKGAVEKSFTATAAVEAKPTQTITVSWPWLNPRLWDVGQPNLYTLRLTATGAGIDDQLNQQFGFREFWVQGRQFYLNGTVIHLRQPCFYYGRLGQVGDDFSEFGSWNVDARGDNSDAGPQLDRADHIGYLAAVYILDANKYIINSGGRIVWRQNHQRATERAGVWMRHYRNHPSVVMWVAGGNFFNNAVDSDPRHVGRRGWGQDDRRWQRLMVAADEMFAGLKKLDPTRVYYSHEGTYTGDAYTMNCYLDLLPLQEREDWLSAWAKDGDMPVAMVEFGTPMGCTFRRGHDGFTSNITSEPLLTEYAAIYFGEGAYTTEEPNYRQFLHDLFRGGMLYNSSQDRLDSFADMHKIQNLFRRNTWRSWRTAGLSGGLRTWSWMQDQLKEVNGPTLAWIAGRPGAYTAKDHHFHGGQTFQKQIVLINDTRRPQDFTAAWTATVNGGQVSQGELHGSLAVSEIRKIPFSVTAPQVPADGKVNGQVTLAATIGNRQHHDTFEFRVFGPDRPRGGRMATVDPEGSTSKMLRELGYTPHAWDGSPAPLVVVGRNGLRDDPAVAARLEPYVRAGGRVLVSAQDPNWMTEALGWRVCPKVSRRVFPMNSSVTEGIDADDLRDWTGSSTLIAAYPKYVGDYFRGNEGGQPYSGWHWGNRGGVTSAAVEKPHRSGWRPLLECEFDLAYTPLMELDYGRGRVILCTLDLEDHMALDPAARRVAQCVIRYALHCPLSPRVNKVVYLGGSAGAAWLDRVGVSFQHSTTLDTGAGLLLIGPNAEVSPAALDNYLEKGGRAFLLPRAEADGPLGAKLKRAPAHFAGSLSMPDWPEARGLSASDLRWRTYLDTPPFIVSGGVEVGADGLLGRKVVGKGVAIFCQVDPDRFQADEKTYFHYTRWRATRAVAQLLANLGATFPVDSRIFHPCDTWKLDLDGAWQMKVRLKLPPASTQAAAHAGPGVTPAAQALVGDNAPAHGWMPVILPQMVPFFAQHAEEAVFRKEIVLPKAEAGEDMTLSLGVVNGFDDAWFDGVEVGHTGIETSGARRALRSYSVPGKLVKAGKNIVAVRLFNRFGPGGFQGLPGLPAAPEGDRSGHQYTGPRARFQLSLSPKPVGVQTLGWYCPDYRTDFPMGDNPYRYYRW